MLMSLFRFNILSIDNKMRSYVQGSLYELEGLSFKPVFL